MTGVQALRKAAKLCRGHARDFTSLASQISREPLKKWIRKDLRYSCASEFASVAMEMICVAIELEQMAKKEAGASSLIARKLGCPTCGPRFRKGYKAFKVEVRRELAKERS